MHKIFLIAACLFFTGKGVVWAQPVQVNGVVTENRQPLAGVSVIVKGSSAVSITDVDGRYSIAAPEGAVLVFSFMGLKTQEIDVGNRTVINVEMEADVAELEEVIVVAYGTATRRAFTGAASVIKSADIAKRQSSNITNMLTGQVAGLQTASSSGQPGAPAAIRIRGLGSYSASSAPLFVVDGMPYEGGLENINAADIESINVLKDATSSSLYGARGANGVIIITTRSGKSRDAVITVDAKAGVNSRALCDYDVIKDPALFYETHYRAIYNYASRQPGQTPASADAFANAHMINNNSYGLIYNVYDIPQGEAMIVNGKLNPAATLGRMVTSQGGQYWLQPDDWAKEAYRRSLRQEYNITVNGSSEKGSNYFSAGFLSDKGFVAGSDFRRFTARVRSDCQVKKWLKVGATAGYAHTAGNYIDATGNSSANIFYSIRSMGPIYPVFVRDANKQVVTDPQGRPLYDWGDKIYGVRPVMPLSNPVAGNMLNTNGDDINNLNANTFAEITFLEDFSFKLSAGADWVDDRTTEFTNRYYGQYAPSNGIIRKQHWRLFTVNLQQLLNWKRRFGNHHLDAMLGHEYYNRQVAFLSGSRSNAFNDEKMEINAAVSNPSANSYLTEYNIEGFFGRVQYDYGQRYFASASYRRDGTSRFHPHHRWGNFWSAGVAWLVNEEAFFHAPQVDLLKFKLSYGSQGNDNIGGYLYDDRFRIATSPAGIGLTVIGLGNPRITWETNYNFNAGVEFQLFDKRLGGNIEYFIRRSGNLLFNVPLPPSFGFGSIGENAGAMRNNGFELEITGTPVKNERLLWTLSFHATHFVNVITKLPAARKDGFETGSYRIEEGKSRYEWYMPQYAGVDDSGRSTWYVNVKDAEGHITGREATANYALASYYFSGSSIPGLFGGISTAVEAAGMDFSFALAYQLGGRSYDAGYAALMYVPSSAQKGYAWHKDIQKAWSENNRSSNIPRLQFADASVTNISDRFLTSASCLSIQNIIVGYTFPKAWTSKIYLSSLRIFAVADNVFLFSARKGFDPRQSFDGSASAQQYAPARTVSAGVSVKF
ncbi:MAG: TonB-dependent receptor [Prevotellaceae bacterium]|jgi:TonB-linked SusC/RagA family outer membrane protein|nr:TonB-dependent receptor [Prevotellaceae bacterium]